MDLDGFYNFKRVANLTIINIKNKNSTIQNSMESLKLQCIHNPKSVEMVFSCNSNGNYSIKLCKKCRDAESKKHLISERNL